MDLNDVTPENFFNKVTFTSDPSPGAKLVIPNGDFILSAILLRLMISIDKLGNKL